MFNNKPKVTASEEDPSLVASYDAETKEMTVGLSAESYEILRQLTQQRECSLGRLVTEALRLERRLAAGDLYVREEGRLKELISV